MSITLNNGRNMPLVGLGCSKSTGEETERKISNALEVGYRHFDCASVYGNEHEIGMVLADEIEKGKVKREDLFITSKLGVSCLHPDQVQPAFERSLKDLQIDYIDLYLIHWPFALVYDGPKNYFPSDKDGYPLLDESVDYVETWRKMEDIYRSGKARAIGISNFNISQVERILKEGSVVPAVNQVECHPFLSQSDLIEYSHSKGIHVTAYSPLGSLDNLREEKTHNILNNTVLQQIAEQHGKSPAQVSLRFQIQRQVSVIPRSSNLSRMNSNLDLFDFSLSSDECSKISSLNSDFRVMCPSRYSKHVHFPFKTM